jgi:hypothetical protein
MLTPRYLRVIRSLVVLAPFPAAAGAQANPWAAIEEAKLTSNDAAAWDQLGISVAISGDTAVAGAHSEDHGGPVESIGAAYVFLRSGTTWSQQQKLQAPVGAAFDFFGWSVAISGDTAVVGAIGDDLPAGGDAGSAYVFVRSGTTWTQEDKLTASDADDENQFGHSVAIDGETIAIGAPGNGLGGAVYVFVRSGTAWTEQQKLTTSDAAAGDDFGIRVAISGETVVGGAWLDDHAGGADAGSAYVFVRNGTSWSQQQKLTASDAAPSDGFGHGVAIAGETVLVGAPNDDILGFSDAGSAYAFVRSGTAWSEQQKLTAADGAGLDWFGNSVAVAGDRALVGVPNDDTTSLSNAGSARLFARSGSTWSEQATLTASDATNGDAFGSSVAMSIDSAVAGAPLDNHAPGGTQSGSAYALRIEPGAPVSYCTAGSSANGCQALLSASGTASASAPSGFVLMAAGVEGKKEGIFLFGANGRQANPWGNGTSYQCVVPPVVRTPVIPASGTNGQCDGSFAFDLNALWCPSCPKGQKNPGSGALAQAQLWYRDPASTSNQTTSLSDAIEFGVGP